MLVATATSSPTRSSITRSTPASGDAAHWWSRAATYAGNVRSARTCSVIGESLLDANGQHVARAAVQHAGSGGAEQQSEAMAPMRAEDDEIHAELGGGLADLVRRIAAPDICPTRRDAETFRVLRDTRLRLLHGIGFDHRRVGRQRRHVESGIHLIDRFHHDDQRKLRALLLRTLAC